MGTGSSSLNPTPNKEILQNQEIYSEDSLQTSLQSQEVNPMIFSYWKINFEPTPNI